MWRMQFFSVNIRIFPNSKLYSKVHPLSSWSPEQYQFIVKSLDSDGLCKEKIIKCLFSFRNPISKKSVRHIPGCWLFFKRAVMCAFVDNLNIPAHKVLCLLLDVIILLTKQLYFRSLGEYIF